MQDFRDLQVWTKSHALTLAVYQATVRFPREELYGLTSQMRRSSASFPRTLPKVAADEGTGSSIDSCRISTGSASELEYHTPNVSSTGNQENAGITDSTR